ncbi:DUF2066 domain-containing protein [Spiribacter vilamensis]|uniref:DUF2066 domain-containing protein n=1 Tax=Spiribacter vilamensis TaxID=531306 RepID=A0A4Q8D0V2_9GAMM|nr:DUF2066 domain-containing protein [Spiribacter vilamensis]RZU98991.1 hypothetical protein EV698_1267 [Spiribacter vilamensis]TVO62005.1 DUF2066 domain-containing protein [Spiribacter vilamensis]
MSVVLRLFLRLAIAVGVVTASPAVMAQGGTASIQVPVAGDSDSARSEGLVRAMDAILVRLTGDPAVVETGLAARLREGAEEYVSGFSYRTVVTDDGDGTGRETRLLVRFSRQSLRNALARAEIAVWPPSPPTVLVWLGAERDGERFIAGSDQGQSLLEPMRAAAEPLGITLITPIMDVEDRRNLGYGDIAGGFVDPVREASARYGAEAVVVGRVQGAGTASVRVRWVLLAEDEAPAERWTSTGNDAGSVLESGVRELVQRLRGPYGYIPDPDSRRRLMVTVGGVESLATHQAVAERLGQQVGVTDVVPVEIVDDRIRWQLAISVEAERVTRALDTDQRLRPDGEGYRWRP